MPGRHGAGVRPLCRRNPGRAVLLSFFPCPRRRCGRPARRAGTRVAAARSALVRRTARKQVQNAPCALTRHTQQIPNAQHRSRAAFHLRNVIANSTAKTGRLQEWRPGRAHTTPHAVSRAMNCPARTSFAFLCRNVCRGLQTHRRIHTCTPCRAS